MTTNLTAREILERFKYCICRLEGETGWVNKEVKEKEIFDDALAQFKLLKLGEEEIRKIIRDWDRNPVNWSTNHQGDGGLVPGLPYKRLAQSIIKAREAKWEGKE